MITKYFCYAFIYSLLNIDKNVIGSSCIGISSTPVDWFIIYKLPKIPKSRIESLTNGIGQAYMDNNNQSWTILQTAISDVNQPIYNTLNQIYSSFLEKRLDSVVYALYNDNTPDSKLSSSKGHTKGNLFFDDKSGYWMIHSVPRFPNVAKKSYSYPDSGIKFGQTILCISLNYSYLDIVGKQLLYYNPQIYDFNFPDKFSKSNPNLAILLKDLKGNKINNKFNVEVIKSIGGQRFISFAKSKKFNQDLYEKLVAPTLKTNLSIETWLNGNGDIPSTCSQNYTVQNILKIKFLNMSFINSQDHSKWAITYLDQKILKKKTEHESKSTSIFNKIYKLNEEKNTRKNNLYSKEILLPNSEALANKWISLSMDSANIRVKRLIDTSYELAQTNLFEAMKKEDRKDKKMYKINIKNNNCVFSGVVSQTNMNNCNSQNKKNSNKFISKNNKTIKSKKKNLSGGKIMKKIDSIKLTNVSKNLKIPRTIKLSRIDSKLNSNHLKIKNQKISSNLKSSVDNSDTEIMDNAKWTCIGDINRQESQFLRGGGTVCLDNINVWKSFSILVENLELCQDIINFK